MTVTVGAFLVAATATLESSWVTRAHQYLGETHTHTTESDGDLTPTQLATAYLGLSHQWIAITDHNMVTADPAVAGITHVRGQEVATTSPPYTPEHVVGLDTASAIAPSASAQDNINAILLQTDLCILAHPIDDAGHRALTGYTHLELSPPSGYPVPLSLWDWLLTAGNHIWAVMADDTHHAYTDCLTALSVDWRGATVVNADDSSAASVLAALRAGNCYATGSTCNGTLPTCYITSIEVSDAQITITVPQSSNIYWYKSSGTLFRTSLAVLTDTYYCHGDEGYVRIKVVCAADTTRIAYSQPIFVTP